MAALAGNAGADSFVFADGVVVTGTIDGGADSDDLDYSAYTTARNVMLTGAGTSGFDGNEVSVSGGFTNIDSIVGTGADSLTGPNADATWNVDATSQIDSGMQTLLFTGVDTITGGSGDDTIVFDGAPTGIADLTVDGGAGTNTATVAGNLDLGVDLFTLANVDSIALDASVTAGSLDWMTSGSVSQSAGVLSANSLTLTAAGGVDLDQANLLGSVSITNHGPGPIDLVNAQSLTIDLLSNFGGNVDVDVTGAINQAGSITSGGGAVAVNAQTGITMASTAITNAGSGQITYITPGGNFVTGQLVTSGNFDIQANTGNIVSAAPVVNFAGSASSQAVLTAGTSIGSAGLPIAFSGFSNQLLATGEFPIVLNYQVAAFISGSGAQVDDRGGNLVNVFDRSSALLGESDAANREDSTDIDWAAYSEEIRLYAINDEGVQLPEDQRLDEFAMLKRRLEFAEMLRERVILDDEDETDPSVVGVQGGGD